MVETLRVDASPSIATNQYLPPLQSKRSIIGNLNAAISQAMNSQFSP
jgi:hypothetical protein